MTPEERHIVDQTEKTCDCVFCSFRCPECNSTNAAVVVEYKNGKTNSSLHCNKCDYEGRNKLIEKTVKRACEEYNIHNTTFLAENTEDNKIKFRPFPKLSKKLLGFDCIINNEGRSEIKLFKVKC
jgi:hypothetical protein